MKVLVWHSIEFIREECLVMKLNRRDGPVVKSLECHVKCPRQWEDIEGF